MRAIRFERYGGAEVLELAEVEAPVPGPKDCLVRLHAAGVNPLDWKIRSGSMRRVWPTRLPFVPGTDLCGRVEAAGAEAEHPRPGEWVFGKLDPRRGGAYAELAAVPAKHLSPKPEALTPEEAAALPVAGLTALQGLRDRGRLRPGQRVLVHGASGGVGHLAVQIATAIGAQVTAVCGPDNVAWVRELGAERVIDYRQLDYRTEDAEYDLIFDAVGRGTYRAAARVLAHRGVWVTTRPTAGLLLGALVRPLFSHRRARAVMLKSRPADLAFLCSLAEQGQLRPRIEQVYPLAEACQAHDRSETGHVAGKLVLRIG